MRLMTWNLNHRTRKRWVPAGVSLVTGELGPELVVLTEYVAGPSHDRLIAEFRALGLKNSLISPYAKGQNQLLVASRWGLEPGEITPPELSSSVRCNFVHAEIPSQEFRILGLRIPDYSKTPRLRRAYWDWLEAFAREGRGTPTVMIGDFNTDPDYPRARCGDRFAALQEAGWIHAAPAAGASYWTSRGKGVRIDHAFATPHFAVKNTQYVREAGGYEIVGSREALSDHAVLIVDLLRKYHYKIRQMG